MGAPEYVTVAGVMPVTISHSTPNGKDQYKLIYTLPGGLEREFKNCGTIEEARAYAQSLAPRVQAELACAGTLVGEEWRRYEHAKPDLKWLKTPVDDLALEWVAVKKLLGDRPALPAVRAYVALLPEDYKDMRLVDLKNAFLAKECKEGSRTGYTFCMNWLIRHVQGLLGADVMVSQLTTKIIEDWVTQKGYAAKTRQHKRDAAVRLLNYGKKCYCVSRDRPSVAQNVPSEGAGRKTKRVEIFEPNVVAKLVKLLWVRRHEKPRYMMMLWQLLFGAFAGIRVAEIGRMDWSELDLPNRRILLTMATTKTGEERPIPIQKGLLQFLRKVRHPRKGPVVFKSAGRALAEFAAEHGIRWVQNGLRHSYGSYRLAVTKDMAALSWEMGNSVRMIRRHYVRVVTPAAKRRYWGMVPPGFAPTARKTGLGKRRRE